MIIKNDYYIMIIQAIWNNQFSKEVTKGFISLLFESRQRTKLTNLKLIIVLNVAYKLYAKALQIYFQ